MTLRKFREMGCEEMCDAAKGGQVTKSRKIVILKAHCVMHISLTERQLAS